MQSLEKIGKAEEKVEVTSDMLSSYQKDTFTQLFNGRHVKTSTATMPSFHSQQKLIPNVHKKNGFIAHGLNLKFYMESELTLDKIYRALKFNLYGSLLIVQ